jgi:hypothetical protein
MADHGYIASAWSNLPTVIVSLLEDLERRELKPPNDVQASGRENGLACSAIVLMAIVIEGAVNRLRYFEESSERSSNEDAGEHRSQREHVLEWIKPRVCADIHARCEEVFCLRDVIAHAHTWKATTDATPTLRFTEEPRREGYRDRRYRKVVDEQTRRSRVLRLNAFPTRVWRRDAYLAYQTMIEVIAALERFDPTEMNFSNWGYHSFKGEDLLLPQIAAGLVVPDDC